MCGCPTISCGLMELIKQIPRCAHYSQLQIDTHLLTLPPSCTYLFEYSATCASETTSYGFVVFIGSTADWGGIQEVNSCLNQFVC